MDGLYKALNDNPMLLYAFVILVIIFHKQIGAAIETALPWLIKKHTKDLIKPPEINPAEIVKSETVKMVDNPRFAGIAREQYIRTLLVEPLGCMTYDAKLYGEYILYEVARAKQDGMKLTWDMTYCKRADRRAKEAWLEAVKTIIKNNGVFVQVVFPTEPVDGLDELYQAMREEIQESKAHCIVARKGADRDPQKDSACEQCKTKNKDREDGA